MRLFKLRSEPVEEKESSEATREDEVLIAGLSDEVITANEAMNVPAFSSCINLIANTVGMIPIKMYKITDNKVEEVADNRVKLINKDTGDTLDGVQFKRALVFDYFMGKGAYAYIKKKGNTIESIHYVDSKEISFMYNTDPIFKDYDIMIRGASYKPYEFLKVLRNSRDGRSGISIIEENKKIIAVSYATLKYELNIVSTGGNRKGFIKSPKKLTEAAIKALKSAWRKLYQNNSENVVILNEGLEFQESSNTSVDLQLNENKKQNGEEMCTIFNIPYRMIYGEATEEDKVNFIQYGVNTFLAALECALDRDLLLEHEKGSFFYAADISELTKGDIKKRYEAYATACKSGFMQADEVRFKENMKPLGLNLIKFGLQDVLYNPETKEFYTPNTNSKERFGKGGETDEDRNKE